MLGGPLITLRPVTPGDVDLLESLDSDPEVMRYISGGVPTPRAMIVEFMIPRMLSQATRPGLGFFIVHENDVPLGWAHLRNDTFEPTWAEVGYRLFRHAWGRGVATRIARDLTARAFDELGFDVVSARTLPTNLASRRVMEKAGLVYAGDFSFPGRELPGMSLPPMPGVLYLKRATLEA